MTGLLVALGAAAGAPLRHLLGVRLEGRLPWGILAANVAGSFLVGLLAGRAVSGDAAALLGTGFCGGFTTYSTFALQAHRLGARAGTTYVVLTVGLALAACALGHLLGG